MSIFSKVGEAMRSRQESSVIKKSNALVMPKLIKESLLDDEILSNFYSTKGQPLNEAMSVADEALYRATEKRFFDTQLIASYLLSEGNFIEMRTGEGKTLVFALTAAILAKRDKSLVTIVTANDYLAERDYLSNKKFFDLLGVSAAYISGITAKEDRLAAYKCDVVYTTLRETAYDYIRDERCLVKGDVFSPIRDTLLVDEADNVLIDNAAHPYTIAESIDTNNDLMIAAHNFAIQSKASAEKDAENYDLSEDGMDIELSQKGIEVLEGFLVKHDFIQAISELYNDENLHMLELFEGAGRAVHLMKEGLDYIVDDNQIVVLDKNSGRPLRGVVLSKGIQQVLEVDKGLELSKESLPSSSITTESLANLFNTIAGMSGTLKVDEDELSAVYGRGCISIPSYKKPIRVDHDDIFFLSNVEKTRYTLTRIIKAYKIGQPVLISATNEGDAVRLQEALLKLNVNSEILISSSLAQEASIIALAGSSHKVTIGTGVAGRGTDIVLGGNLEHFIENNLIPDDEIPEARKQQIESRKKVVDAGGLLVIGYGRQMVRKLDLQLMGRAGRQGDPGESIFISSLEDSLLGEHGVKLRYFLEKMAIKETDMLSHPSITKALDNAQRGHRDRILKSRKASAALSSQLEEQRKVLYDMRMNFLMSDESNFASELESNTGIEGLPKSLTKMDALLKFDDAIFSYQSSIDDLKRSIFLQSFANKSPMQEIKKKAFLEYELFMNRLISSITNKDDN